jgi:hypothetical protein
MESQIKSTNPRRGKRGQARKVSASGGHALTYDNRNDLANQVANLNREDHLRIMVAIAYNGFIEARWNQRDGKLLDLYERSCVERDQPMIVVRPRGVGKYADLRVDFTTARSSRRPGWRNMLRFFENFAGRGSIISSNVVTRIPTEKARLAARFLAKRIRGSSR